MGEGRHDPLRRPGVGPDPPRLGRRRQPPDGGEGEGVGKRRMARLPSRRKAFPLLRIRGRNGAGTDDGGESRPEGKAEEDPRLRFPRSVCAARPHPLRQGGNARRAGVRRLGVEAHGRTRPRRRADGRDGQRPRGFLGFRQRRPRLPRRSHKRRPARVVRPVGQGALGSRQAGGIRLERALPRRIAARDGSRGHPLGQTRHLDSRPRPGSHVEVHVRSRERELARSGRPTAAISSFPRTGRALRASTRRMRRGRAPRKSSGRAAKR